MSVSLAFFTRPGPRLWSLVAALLLAGLLGCQRGRAGSPPRGPKAALARGLAAGDARLVKAMRAVLADCQLREGELRACASAAETELVAAERAAGPGESLRTYCRGLEEQAAPVRQLCAARLRRFDFPRLLGGLASPALFECLLAGLGRVEASARPGLAHAAALMAPRLGREDKLLARARGRRARSESGRSAGALGERPAGRAASPREAAGRAGQLAPARRRAPGLRRRRTAGGERARQGLRAAPRQPAPRPSRRWRAPRPPLTRRPARTRATSASPPPSSSLPAARSTASTSARSAA